MFERVLVVYKKSNYEHYVLKEHSAKLKKHKDISKPLLDGHKSHYESLEKIEKVLDDLEVRYSIVVRSKPIEEKKHDLVITVGGDGTFLESSQYLTEIPILGINSDPSSSVGFFCAIHASELEKFLHRNSFSLLKASRLKVEIDGKIQKPALNDILITNIHPASTSRYTVQVGNEIEDQKSSGVWVSTAIGSTAAIRGAGGRRLNKRGNKFQMKVREPYILRRMGPKLDRLVLEESEKIKIKSCMRDGRVYQDGTKRVSSFIFGSEVVVSGDAPKLTILGL